MREGLRPSKTLYKNISGGFASLRLSLLCVKNAGCLRGAPAPLFKIFPLSLFKERGTKGVRSP